MLRLPHLSPAALTRRDLLRRSGIGLGLLGLAGVLADHGELAAAPAGGDASPLALKRPHFPGRAKRVVHFFLN
ncbi:MAG TPA: twin-arginine translocation signal domain-containing protein, partial [Planctomycetaceae bacterium]